MGKKPLFPFFLFKHTDVSDVHGLLVPLLLILFFSEVEVREGPSSIPGVCAPASGQDSLFSTHFLLSFSFLCSLSLVILVLLRKRLFCSVSAAGAAAAAARVSIVFARRSLFLFLVFLPLPLLNLFFLTIMKTGEYVSLTKREQKE